MEYWNLYDYKGKKKNKIAIRGTKLNNDDFHLVVNAWILNDKGEFLITQRAANKSHPLMWECTGGSALIGENSLQAAIREVKEELGIDVSNSSATFIGESRRFYDSCPDILHVWLFKSNEIIDNIKIQEEEINDVMWASKEKILQLFKDNKFEANSFFNKVININSNEKMYYVGFNANNAICNECFLDGAITLNPNREKGNIYYTKNRVIDKTSEEFLLDYKKYLVNTMEEITLKYKNTTFLAFNKKIKELLNDENKFNILGEKDYSSIDKLNDKKYTRELLKDKVPIIEMNWIDKKINFDTAKSITNSEKVVIQGKVGAGGNNTYFIDTEEKFNKYISMCNDEYYLSKYIEHLPINVTIIIGKNNDVILPTSIQLIKLENDRFKYVGADFIYSQKLNAKINEQIKKYSSIIIDEVKKQDYKGILGIDYIVDDNDNVYFMEINPRFQSSSFIINNYLSKYCFTSIAELHYLAITDGYIGNTYLDKVDNSFVNCTSINDYAEFEHYKTIKNGYYAKNKSSVFRKVFNYSILKNGCFQKRKCDK